MKPEILSPAGSMEALQAAHAAGADAVYLGASLFGARVHAGFDDEALQAAVNLAHLHGRRIYVTVNTLLKQQELQDVRRLLRRLVELRVDAVIVQDLGLTRLIKAEFPGLCIHASTQMSVHNASGARVLQDLGISRVVLARECSLEDIQAVAKTGIETEVFVHGAMCVSVSGQCLLSSQIGGRSGNRGRCAQPCRLQYTYKQHTGALLSMRDMNTLEHIPELLQAGASSFKIEGRLKRPEYVYLVTSKYRKALDLALLRTAHPDLQKNQEELAQVFSRGFTAGHALSREDSDLLGTLRVSHLGSQIATVATVSNRGSFVLASAVMDSTLNNGDGLQIRGSREQDLIYSGPVVLKGQQAVLRLRTAPVPGDTVWRMQDEAQLSSARAAYETLPRLPFDARLILSPGQPSHIEVRHGATALACTGALVQPAQNQPLDAASTRRQIAKTGHSPFELASYQFESTAPAFLPSAALNALRRDALTQLEAAIITAHPLPDPGVPVRWTKDAAPRQAAPSPKLYAILPATMNQAPFAGLVDQVILYPDNFREGRLEEQLAQVQPQNLVLLPKQIKDIDLLRISRLLEGTGAGVVANNVGQLQQRGLMMCGDGIPTWNAETLAVLAGFGAKAVLLSRELSDQEIRSLPRDILELVVPVYGSAQVMQLNHCPERLSRNLSRNRAGCRFCERGEGIIGQHLVDRLGYRFPLSPTHFNHGCLVAMHDHKRLNLQENAPQGLSWVLDLRLESPEDALMIAGYYAGLMRGEKPEPVKPYEPGRYFLGVE